MCMKDSCVRSRLRRLVRVDLGAMYMLLTDLSDSSLNIESTDLLQLAMVACICH